MAYLLSSRLSPADSSCLLPIGGELIFRADELRLKSLPVRMVIRLPCSFIGS